jgi:hypothetical protein
MASGALGTRLVALTERRMILGSVAADGSSNFGNVLIHRATLKALRLPPSTPAFSVFEPMTSVRARQINSYDVVVFTGCTILQMSPGHQRFFNDLCNEIRIPRICLGAAFCCEEEDLPPLDLARWFTAPIAARDPWTSSYLSRHGIANHLVGCPTLLARDPLPSGWMQSSAGVTLVSSTPRLVLGRGQGPTDGPVRLVRHEAGAPGVDVRSRRLFEGVRGCITGRLHLALPAIAAGIPTRFFGPRFWSDERVARAAGTTRFSLLRFLGLSAQGKTRVRYPRDELAALRASFVAWQRECDL